MLSIFLVVLVTISSLLLSPCGITVTPAEAANLASTNYDLKAELDYASGALQVVETVNFVNTVGQPLDSLVFNVIPAYFDAFELKTIEVAGQEVTPDLQGVVLEVPLTEPLAPGASVAVRITFSETVPAPGNLRFGRANGITALGNWYPVLSVWRGAESSADGSAGWRRDPYVDTGDAFFTATADYDVSLSVNAKVVVAHTGDVVSHEGSEWVFHASNVRDFALAVSARYETKSVVVGDTTVTAFYLPEHESAGQQYLDSASESLAWFNQTLGTYPYATMQVAETNTDDPSWVGQEYPNIVFISNQSSAAGGGVGSYLDYLVVHENCHQWFYGLVGDDQIYEPWVDEATVVYMSYMYFRANYPQVYQSLWQNTLNNYEITKQTWGDRPIDTSIYDYQDENHYFGIVYRKGSIFLDELRQLMGDDAFFGFLRRLVQANEFGIISGRQFLNAAQESAPTSIAPLVSRFFSHQGYLVTTPTPEMVSPTPMTVMVTTTESATPSTAETLATAEPTPSSSPLPTAGKTGSAVTVVATSTAEPIGPVAVALHQVLTPAAELLAWLSSDSVTALRNQVGWLWTAAIPAAGLILLGIVMRGRRR